MTATHERRITDLEAASYRLSRRMDDTESRHAEAIEHLTSAVGDLSQGQRALTFDLGEVRRELDEVRREVGEVRATVGRVEREHGELLRAILARLQQPS
jgi:hypothetical protein